MTGIRFTMVPKLNMLILCAANICSLNVGGDRGSEATNKLQVRLTNSSVFVMPANEKNKKLNTSAVLIQQRLQLLKLKRDLNASDFIPMIIVFFQEGSSNEAIGWCRFSLIQDTLTCFLWDFCLR